MSIFNLFKDAYSIKARFVPSLFASVPFAFMLGVLVLNYVPLDVDNACRLLRCGAIFSALSLVFVAGIWMLAFIIRGLAKYIESIVYCDGLTFPTTQILLWRNSYFPDAYKREIHKKILKDFSIRLASRTKELDDEINARKIIALAVKRVRDKICNGRIVLQYNIHYGVVRNGAIGALIALVPSLTLIPVGIEGDKVSWIFSMGVVLSLLYAIILIISIKAWKYFAWLYAKNLIEEYMEI